MVKLLIYVLILNWQSSPVITIDIRELFAFLFETSDVIKHAVNLLSVCFCPIRVVRILSFVIGLLFTFLIGLVIILVTEGYSIIGIL